MAKLNLKARDLPGGLAFAVKEISAEKGGVIGRGGRRVIFERSLEVPGHRAEPSGDAIVVRYSRTTDALRALGRLLSSDEGELAKGFSERPRFDTLGIMVDVSRNAVARVETVRTLIRRCALMGLNMLMLYAEDTYEVPGEPFFGYLRGRYTQKELKQLDDYAAAFGIEMVPCIEALAHLEQILQWPAYAKYRDTTSVILAEDKATYALVAKMIRAASAPFRSKRIHIGMDEAHGIGTGRYKQKHGNVDPFVILNRHLKRVNNICKSLGLRPMIWSDMYFRIGSKTHQYYDRKSVIPDEVARNIPKGVQLVYWDYYHGEQDFYQEWIDRHVRLAGMPMMAGGVWTWNRFWADLKFSFKNTDACMKACKKKGLREAIVTLWGDDGNECDVFSALPGILFFAEHGWSDRVDRRALPARFAAICGGDFKAMVRASDLDNLWGTATGDSPNPSKWLLWQDPLLSLLDPIVEKIPAAKHYRELAADLARASRKKGNAILAFPAQHAKVLSLKVGLGRSLRSAWKRKDKRALRRLVRGDLARLRREVRRLWRLHRAMWLERYKPFGWEVIEVRYGGLLARLESLSERLGAYLAGKGPGIPELDVVFKRTLAVPRSLPNLPHSRAKTPSYIK